MSKFIDKLKRLSRSEPQPIGFRAKQTATPKSKIQLVASLAQESAESLTSYVAGADAGLLLISRTGTGTEAMKTMSQALPDIPWGVRLQGGGGGMKQLSKAGYDFIVFPAASTPLALIENEEAGKILEVETSLNEGLLRAVNELPIDAVLVSGVEKEGRFLTWQHLMLYQRFADLLTKPLLVCIPEKVTGSELQALWEVGINGVVVEVSPGQTQDSVNKLRQLIDKLEFPSPRRREKAEAVLPRIGSEPSISTREGDEEEY